MPAVIAAPSDDDGAYGRRRPLHRCWSRPPDLAYPTSIRLRQIVAAFARLHNIPNLRNAWARLQREMAPEDLK